jgi:hypothetical protein
MMTEHEKLRAEIEARLVKFDESLEVLDREAAKRQEKFDASKRAQLDSIKKQKAEAEAKLREMDGAEEAKKHRLAEELKRYVVDIDENLREALSYLAY